MRAILLKEIRSFFSSLTGYIAIIIFLLVNAWFMWIGPGEFNVLDGGYANLDTLFTLAPWVFLFLLPAVTMRLFAEEKKSGTIELLLTKPVSKLQLVLGKYFAAVLLAALALLPTLVYYYSVHQLGNPVGNLDAGSIWGSYIGLLFLAAGYAAIGIFASTLTANQIVAYILAAVGCFFCYTGFDGLSQLFANTSADSLLLALGINEHYKSVSRGVVDSRDIVYFLSLITFFLALTLLVLQSNKRRYAFYTVIVIAGLFPVNIIAQHFFFRLDLTADKRYTISNAGKEAVKSLDNLCYVQVFLDGEMPIPFRKLQATIRETLDELKVYAGKYIQYEFIDIEKEVAGDSPDKIYAALQSYGLAPFITQENTGSSTSERVLFPGALINYTTPVPQGDSMRLETRQMAVNFLQNNARKDPEAGMLIAQQNVEYELVSAISRISRKQQPRVAFIEGHGELDEYETGDITKTLSEFCRIDRMNIMGRVGVLNDYALVVIARPMQAWPEADKLALDQYIMQGGAVAWFMDEVHVHHDSLANGFFTFALAAQHGLEDQLFRYGVRINPTIIQDLQCSFLPVNIAPAGQQVQFKPMPWNYYPLLNPPSDNVITGGLNLIMSQYPGSIDTVNSNPGVKKDYLLYSSQYSRTQQIPIRISLSELSEQNDPAHFGRSFLPVALSLEGVFPSAFLNRPLEKYNNGEPFRFLPESAPTKMIVVADGDIIRNEVSRRADGTRILPLGYDRYTGTQFGNKNLVKNMLFYLLGEDNLLRLRSREWELRLLDKRQIKLYRSRWVAVNTIVPPLLVLLAGGLFIWLRKRKYSKFARP